MLKIKEFLLLYSHVLTPKGFATILAIIFGFFGRPELDLEKIEHKDHPIFQNAPSKNGKPDFCLQLTNIQLKQTNPKKNSFHAILDVANRDNGMPADLREKYAKRINFTETPNRRLKSFSQLQTCLGESPKNLDAGALKAGVLCEKNPCSLWEKDALKLQSESLDYLLEQLDQRPGYAAPIFFQSEVKKGQYPRIEENHIHCYRYLTRWLASRARLRMQSDQLELAWRDIRGIYQLSNRLGQGPTVVGYATACSVAYVANEHLEVLLKENRCHPKLYARIIKEFQAIQLPKDWVRAYDLSQRAFAMNKVQFWLERGLGERELPIYFPIAWIDPNLLANYLNTTVDTIVDGGREHFLDVAMEDFSTHDLFIGGKRDLQLMVWKLAQGDSPRLEVTSIAHLHLKHSLLRPFSQLETNSFRNQNTKQILLIACAVRIFEDKHNKFPTEPAQLSKILPNLNSPLAKEPFEFKVTGETLEIRTPVNDFKIEDSLQLPRLKSEQGTNANNQQTSSSRGTPADGPPTS